MRYDPERHHRRSIRLRGYDYGKAGYYFVTLVTYHRHQILGWIVDGKVRLSRAGTIVAETLEWLGEHFENVSLDEWVIMPDHIHFILVITKSKDPTPKKQKPLGNLIAAFKTVSTKLINLWRHTPGERVWHRDYYDRIIRSRQQLYRTRVYIRTNPIRCKGGSRSALP